jgi:hypothetical protein
MGEGAAYDGAQEGENAVKRVLDILTGRRALAFLVVSIASLAMSASSFAATSTPAAPSVDVNANATGVFSALSSNLTARQSVGGRMAGVFIILRLVKRFAGGHGH